MTTKDKSPSNRESGEYIVTQLVPDSGIAPSPRPLLDRP